MLRAHILGDCFSGRVGQDLASRTSFVTALRGLGRPNVPSSQYVVDITAISLALVRSRGLEPPRVSPLAPQASASTNSATTAKENEHPETNSGATGGAGFNKLAVREQGSWRPSEPAGSNRQRITFVRFRHRLTDRQLFTILGCSLWRAERDVTLFQWLACAMN
jgi:hypothetical protein